MILSAEIHLWAECVNVPRDIELITSLVDPVMVSFKRHLFIIKSAFKTPVQLKLIWSFAEFDFGQFSDQMLNQSDFVFHPGC